MHRGRRGIVFEFRRRLGEGRDGGPLKGTLVIVGGGSIEVELENIFRRFVELAGGDEANIVIVPTAASSGDEYDYEKHEQVSLARDTLGLKNVTVVHTHDRRTAETEEFVRPIRNADAVWFTEDWSGVWSMPIWAL